MRMENDREAYAFSENVRLVPAYMPEPFGTHHTKMLVLFSADATGGGAGARGGGATGMCRVIIHTANMIPFDWGNMTQGVWDSGWLPPLSPSAQVPTIGAEFKSSLLTYLRAYGSARTGELIKEVPKYDFSTVRAVFLGSTPGRHKLDSCPFGWPALQRILSKVSIPENSRAKVVMQLSSIATLTQGGKDTWFTPVFCKALAATAPISGKKPKPKPDFALIFPTPDEIRQSLNGYESGGAVHLKLSSKASLLQLEYLKPILCRWSARSEPPSPSTITKSTPSSSSAKLPSKTYTPSYRALAAPHIKTYIRFQNPLSSSRDFGPSSTISWALLTSANLSTQAWGSAPTAPAKEVRISSYEAGVLVFPELFKDETHSKRVVMTPVFHEDVGGTDQGKGEGGGEDVIKVDIRIPYDMPLTPYSKTETPWTPGGTYDEPDWMDRRYDPAG